MAKKKYKANVSWRRSLPFIVSETIGIDNYNKLQNDEVVTMEIDISNDMLQYLEEVKIKASPKKKKKSSGKEKK